MVNQAVSITLSHLPVLRKCVLEGSSLKLRLMEEHSKSHIKKPESLRSYLLTLIGYTP